MSLNQLRQQAKIQLVTPTASIKIYYRIGQDFFPVMHLVIPAPRPHMQSSL